MILIKKHIALFFLLLFISIKSISLHTFFHSEMDHLNDCHVCEFVIESNKIPLVINDSFQSKELIEHYYKKEVHASYSYQYTNQYGKNTLFYRPPPLV